MELTLLLASADVARLQRLPTIKAARSGRSRGQAVQTVWYDSLDRELASQGLALTEQRGTWRLEQHRPAATEPWPPATDHRLIVEANDLEALRHALAEADHTKPALRRAWQVSLNGRSGKRIWTRSAS